MSIAQNFPNIKPSLMLSFADTKQLDNRITFTRSTPAVYYDGKTTAMAEQNLLLYSQDFNSWGNASAPVTANSTTAPDGTTTADSMAVNATVSYLYIGVNAIAVAGTYTFSCYVKAGTNNFVALNIQGNISSWVTAVYNLSTGAVTQTANGSTGIATINSTSITSAGNGWYRCVLTASCTSGVLLYPSVMFAPSATGNTLSSTYGEPSGNTTGNTLLLWGAQIEARSAATAYTATTTQPITNYIPVLLSAGGNQARFDCNPTTGESLGLLIEEQRTNLQIYSQDFSNAHYTTTRCSISSNVAIAPDGTLTADRIVEDTTNGLHRVFGTAPATLNVTYSFSCYAKVGSGNRNLQLLLGSGFGENSAEFNLLTGTVVSTFFATANIISVGNGWYRCGIVATSSITTSITTQIYNVNSGLSYTGDGFSGNFIWGAQFEQGSFATSYIATTSASATRTADSASMTGANFSSWYAQGQGTLYVEYKTPNSQNLATNNMNIIGISNGDANNRIRFLTDAGTNFNIANNGTIQVALGSSWVANTYLKWASIYQTNNFAFVSNGGTVNTSTIGTVPYVTQMQIGQLITNREMTGYIKKFSYYPVALTSANIQALTS
jgi:hypothetical protein